jgi:hypothetical protein
VAVAGRRKMKQEGGGGRHHAGLLAEVKRPRRVPELVLKSDHRHRASAAPAAAQARRRLN